MKKTHPALNRKPPEENRRNRRTRVLTPARFCDMNNGTSTSHPPEILEGTDIAALPRAVAIIGTPPFGAPSGLSKGNGHPKGQGGRSSCAERIGHGRANAPPATRRRRFGGGGGRARRSRRFSAKNAKNGIGACPPDDPLPHVPYSPPTHRDVKPDTGWAATDAPGMSPSPVHTATSSPTPVGRPPTRRACPSPSAHTATLDSTTGARLAGGASPAHRCAASGRTRVSKNRLFRAAARSRHAPAEAIRLTGRLPQEHLLRGGGRMFGPTDCGP